MKMTQEQYNKLLEIQKSVAGYDNSDINSSIYNLIAVLIASAIIEGE